MKPKKTQHKNSLLLLMAASPILIAPQAIMPTYPFYSSSSLLRLILKCALLIYLIIIIPTSFIWKAKKHEKYLHFYNSKLFLIFSLVFVLMLLILFYVLFPNVKYYN